MRFKKLLFISAAFVLSTSVFAANQNEKISAISKSAGNSYQPSSVPIIFPSWWHIYNCPPAEEISYSRSRWKSADGDWESDSYYPRSSFRPRIKFLEARVIGMGQQAAITEDITCIYKINTWQEIITMKPIRRDRKSTYLYHDINWQSVARPDDGYIERRCTKSIKECGFSTGGTYR